MNPALSKTCIGVVDVETTGLFPFRHDRVVEVAAVVADAEGRILREFVSLVNPERDIGPSSIHGLRSADVLGAPTFRDVAPLLVATLDGAVAIGGHNVRFDAQFLACEFQRLERAWPECPRLCTMQLAGRGKLAVCCRNYGIAFDGDAHSALIDARAAARLLGCLLKESPHVADEVSRFPRISWPPLSPGARGPLTREASRQCQEQPPGYLQRLVGRLADEPLPTEFDTAALSYSALLDRVIEDRRIDDCEGEALLEMAMHWGMSRNQVENVHRCYVDRLAVAAVADGVVSDVERGDLHLVCRLLGDTRTDLDAILDQAAASLRQQAGTAHPAAPSGKVQPGMSVCFTGELACSHCGRPITREVAEQLATQAGLQVVETVTKRLDILVVADPETQSGKAKKARQYGLRILHEPVFWSAIGVDVR